MSVEELSKTIFAIYMFDVCCQFAVLMKKPSVQKKIDLACAIPFHEFGMDSESEQCQKLGQLLKKFYFGFAPLSADTIYTYLMVRFNRSHDSRKHCFVLISLLSSLLLLLSSCWAINFSFIQHIVRYWRVRETAVPPHTCIDSVSIHLRSVWPRKYLRAEMPKVSWMTACSVHIHKSSILN